MKTQKPISSTSSRWRRTGVRLAVSCWLVYLVAGALFTFTPIGPLIIAPHPERCSVTWDLAWTIIPGVAHVRGLEVKQHTGDAMWRLHIDRAVTGVNLFALPFKTFHALSPRASGVSTTLEHAPTTMPPQEKKKPGFRLLFSRMSAQDIRSIDLFAAHIEGEAISVRGSLDTTARGPMGIPRAVVKIEGGKVLYEDRVVVEALRLDISAEVEKHFKNEIPESGFLSLASGRIDIDGDTAELAALDTILTSVPWMNVHGGQGHVKGTLELDHGTVSSDSHLEVDTSVFTFDFLTYVASGQGVLTIDGVAQNDSDVDVRVVFNLENYDLRFADREEPHVEGENLNAQVVGRLAAMLRPGGHFSITIDLPQAEVPDLTVYNRYLKAGQSVEILSGAGRISSHLEASTVTNEGFGSIDLTARGVVLNIEDRPIVSDLISNAVFRSDDIKNKKFALDGTKIKLENARVGTPDMTPQEAEVPNQEWWWCDITINEGQLEFGKPVELDIKTTLIARDAAPALAMMTETRKGEKRLDKLLGIRDLHGSARIAIRDGATALLDVQAEGGRAEIMGNMCTNSANRTGLFYIRYGVLSLTTEIDGPVEDKRYTGPRKYFVEKAAEFSCAGLRPRPVENKKE